MTTVTCTRCSGSGRHSYNLRDGEVCYGCWGKGTMELTPAQVKARAKSANKAAAKQAQHAENARKAAELVARLQPVLEEKFGARVEIEGQYRFVNLEAVAMKTLGIWKREALAEALAA